MAELRKFGVTQICPLCRTPLPPGPEKLNVDALKHYMAVSRLVEQGKASWSALSPSLQVQADAAIAGWRAAAEQGDPGAQRNLANMLEMGKGVPKNITESVRLYRAAADQGHACAQCALGGLFEKGLGVEQNNMQAIE